MTRAKPDEAIWLGRQGENSARQVVFSVGHLRRNFGSGSVELLAQRAWDDSPYPVAAEQSGDEVRWTIGAADVAQPGRGGRVELRYYAGETVVKTETWPTVVDKALGEAGETPPEPARSWVDRALRAGEAATAAAERAEAAAIRQPVIQNGTWWIWDPGTNTYRDTGESASGPEEIPEGGNTGQVLMKLSGEADGVGWSDLPVFDGTYEVTPRAFASVTLRTQQKYLDRDVVIQEIPVYETSNQSGGYTANIGG